MTFNHSASSTGSLTLQPWKSLPSQMWSTFLILRNTNIISHSYDFFRKQALQYYFAAVVCYGFMSLYSPSSVVCADLRPRGLFPWLQCLRSSVGVLSPTWRKRQVDFGWRQQRSACAGQAFAAIFPWSIAQSAIGLSWTYHYCFHRREPSGEYQRHRVSSGQRVSGIRLALCFFWQFHSPMIPNTLIGKSE